jgi:hypothetical protein
MVKIGVFARDGDTMAQSTTLRATCVFTGEKRAKSGIVDLKINATDAILFRFRNWHNKSLGSGAYLILIS